MNIKVGQIWKRDYDGDDDKYHIEVISIYSDGSVRVRSLDKLNEEWRIHFLTFPVRYTFVQGPT